MRTSSLELEEPFERVCELCDDVCLGIFIHKSLPLATILTPLQNHQITLNTSSPKRSRFYSAIDNEVVLLVLFWKMQEFSFASLLRVCGCYDESNEICPHAVHNESVKTQVIGYHQLCCPRAWVYVVTQATPSWQHRANLCATYWC